VKDETTDERHESRRRVEKERRDIRGQRGKTAGRQETCNSRVIVKRGYRRILVVEGDLRSNMRSRKSSPI
jgi:hypothetical protein